MQCLEFNRIIMTSILLIIGLFTTFTLIGISIFWLIDYRQNYIINWLIAPVVGISMTTIIVMILNQAGNPVSSFSRYLLAVLLFGCVLIGLWRKPIIKKSLLAPFLFVFLPALFYTSWPGLITGLNWLSYSNDDMANYSLAAMRHLNYGFYHVPTVEQLTSTDFSQSFWFMHVPGFIRFGSEILLSWVCGVTGLNALSIFMPTICTLAIAQVTATCALAIAVTRNTKIAITAGILLSLSPLFLLGTYYQLIAQVYGLSLLASIAALFMPLKVNKLTKGHCLKISIIGCILISAVLVTYPEITPFLGIAFIVYCLGVKLSSKLLPWKIVGAGILSLCLTTAILRYNLITYAVTLIGQTQSSLTDPKLHKQDSKTAETPQALYAKTSNDSQSKKITPITLSSELKAVVDNGKDPYYIFPYYLLPSGAANYFGFITLGAYDENFLTHIKIFLGAILLLYALSLSIRYCIKGNGAACIYVVMAGLVCFLFYKDRDFGLFKIAMFSQPFLAILFAISAFPITPRKLFIPVLLILILVMPTGIEYARVSLGQSYGRFAELPNISQHKAEVSNFDNPDVTVSNLAHVSAAKFTALLNIGTPTKFLVSDFFGGIRGFGLPIPKSIITTWHPHAQEIFAAEELREKVRIYYEYDSVLGTQFEFQNFDKKLTKYNIDSAVPNDIFNASHENSSSKNDTGPYFQAKKIDELQNILIFINSLKGPHFYSPNRGRASLFQLESDPYNESGYMSALGKFFLFQIINPTDSIYVKLNISKSLLEKSNKSWTHKPSVTGENSISLPLIGSGSANIYVGPLKPFYHKNNQYIAIDFDENGARFPYEKNGLMKLYNRMVPIDGRYIVAFGRDISVISSNEFDNLDRPTEIKKFPSDLVLNKALEYSGWFEDGWISKDSFAVLKNTNDYDLLIIRGSVPGIGAFQKHPQVLHTSINEVNIANSKITYGDFVIELKIPENLRAAKFFKINLSFDTDMLLPSPDNRPVSAKIAYLGLGKN